MLRIPLGKRWSTSIAAVAAILLIVLGATVLAGWIARIPALIQIQPQLPPMTRNVAASFLLCGTALLTLTLDGPRWIVALCAAPVVFVSSLSYADFAFQLNSGIHEILGPSYINVQLRSPGRMAPITAVSLLVASGSLLAIATVLPVRTGLALSLNGCVVAAFGMVATLYTRPSLSALHTGVGIAILGIALVALAWRSAPATQPTPPWLPLAIAAAMAGMTAALLRALLVGGYPPSAPLPAVVLVIGTVLGPLLAFTVFMVQRTHAQAAVLARSQAFLEEAQSLSRTGSFAWEVATGEITCSPELHRILEVDHVTLDLLRGCLGEASFLAFQDKSAPAEMSRLRVDREHKLELSHGPDKHLHVVAHAVAQKNGAVECIGTVQDVSAQRSSEQALAELRSEFARVARISSLGALTASIAHEVQQPLAAIIVNAATCQRMLAAETPNVPGALETARRTIRDGNRAAEVISRLRLLFANKPFTTEALDLNDAAREVLALCASELQRAGVQLQPALCPAALVVRGDRIQLQQVILNLVLNACEAMAAAEQRTRELVIRSGEVDGHAQLSVEDTGPGIASEASGRLFEAFYSTKEKGMGIGLSVSRSILERHEGRIWAVGNDGGGATFAFMLPLAAGDAHAATERCQKHAPA